MKYLWTATTCTSMIFLVILITFLVGHVHSNDNWRVAYEWKGIDFKYANADERWSAIQRHEFEPENVIPFGIEVYQSRLFITLPRWRSGIPASLAYIHLNDTSTKSPDLTPYPSWEAHNLNEMNPELVSPFRVRADRCGRLWVLDSRISGVLENTLLYGPAQLLVYDLHNDNLLRRHVFPRDYMKDNSFYANLAVEDGNCDNTFAYAADLGSPGLVVYSWQQDESWIVRHNYFHPDPLAGNYSISGLDFQWDDGLYGLALSKMEPNGFSTLYFHPLSSTMEFSVSTMILRNKTLIAEGDIYKEFKILGSRGPNGQAGASFLDQSRGVLFYALPNLNAVTCWVTSNGTHEYTVKSQGRVYTDPVKMIFPSDIKVDDQDRLWVLSNRLPEYIYDHLYPGTVLFHILTAPVKDAIKNTACDVNIKSLPEIYRNTGGIQNNTIENNNSNISAGSNIIFGYFLLHATLFTWLIS